MAQRVRRDLDEIISARDVQAVRSALQHGADPNGVPDQLSMPPLHWAVVLGIPEIVKLLLDAGADVNYLDYHRRTPMHYAAMGLTKGSCQHCLEILDTLSSGGADLDVKDSLRRTPIDYAVWMGNPEAEKALETAGARRNRQFESRLERESREDRRPKSGRGRDES